MRKLKVAGYCYAWAGEAADILLLPQQRYFHGGLEDAAAQFAFE
jgi:hypothetical protein